MGPKNDGSKSSDSPYNGIRLFLDSTPSILNGFQSLAGISHRKLITTVIRLGKTTANSKVVSIGIKKDLQNEVKQELVL